MGLGDCKDNAKALEMAVNDVTAIAGQKPMVTKAKKASFFKLREGMNIRRQGSTLRGSRMEEFMDKLVNIALPRVRDFRGVSTRPLTAAATTPWSIRQQLLFPEIEYDRLRRSAAWK